MNKIKLLLSFVFLSYSWNLNHSGSCNHYLFNSTTLSYVCDQTLYQYSLNTIDSTPDTASSPSLSQTYNLNHNFQTIMHISQTHILGSAKDCTSFRLTYSSCDPLTLTSIGGLSSEITTTNRIWLDEIQLDFPYLFLFDYSTYELDISDVSQHTKVSKATATFEGRSFRLQVSRISHNINLILLYHPLQENQVYEFDRTTHALSQVSSFENPITGNIADAQMFGRYIVYVHFSLIMVFRHSENGATGLSCELYDSSTPQRFSSDFKKRVYFTQQSDLVFGTFTNNQYVYVITISKPTGSCFIKGYRFSSKQIAFGYYSSGNVYSFYEFNGLVEQKAENQHVFMLPAHEFEFEAWMIVLIVIPLVIIIVVIILLCVVSSEVKLVFETEKEEKREKRKIGRYDQEEGPWEGNKIRN